MSKCLGVQVTLQYEPLLLISLNELGNRDRYVRQTAQDAQRYDFGIYMFPLPKPPSISGVILSHS